MAIEPLPHRTALITGASAGLGEAFAQALARRGCDLVLVARREGRLHSLAQSLEKAHGIKALVIAQDLSVPDAGARIIDALDAAEVAPDILVNNAGYSIAPDYLEADWPAQRDFIMTSVMAVCALTHALVPAMVARRWGRVINLSSIVAFAPGGSGHTLYPAAKSFTLRFSQSLREEVRGHGVKVTAVCPGSTATEFQSVNMPSSTASSGFWVQSAAAVVESSLRANAAGRAVHVPGWHNKAIVTALKLLPDALLLPLIRIGQRALAKQESEPS
tara:strand:- start:7781 stop:8602 length:822 start_codon:yes stop_codon:yes gene_type:complete